MAVVAITHRIPEQAAEALRAGHTVRSLDRDGSPRADVLALVEGADAVVTVITDRVDDEFLDAAGPSLRIVANVAVGVDNIDVPACERRGIVVTNTPGILMETTADTAFGLMLMVTRRFGEAERLVRSGTPWRWGMSFLLGRGLQGKVLGIVGAGQIGLAMARRARAFGMDIVYTSRSRVAPDVEAALGARRLELGDLLAVADVVSLHCPLLPETRHLIDAAALEFMRPTAYLVNTARGAIVDESALVDALRGGSIAGAGLDVFEHEPDVHPGLLELENVVLLPHLGSATLETRGAMADAAARNVLEVLAGRQPVSPVTVTRA